MSLEATEKYRKTKKGLVTNLYHKMKSRYSIGFELSFLHQFSDCKKFDRLYDEWVKSGYNKQLKPSIDRISCKKNYDIDNIHWLTWAENRYKQTMERRHRGLPVRQLLNGQVVAEFKSQRDAVMTTGISQSNMSSALNGKRNTCCGYYWEYIQPTNIHQSTNKI